MTHLQPDTSTSRIFTPKQLRERLAILLTAFLFRLRSLGKLLMDGGVDDPVVWV